MKRDLPEPDAPMRTFAIDGVPFPVRAIEPALHLVSTPIGNLEDVSLRALRTLAAADILACEDTRITSRLLSRYAITARSLSYNDHNAAGRRPQLLAALANGESVALVSDAGTPLVSDPGYRLVDAAIAAGHRVLAVPGPSALLAGLTIAGLPTDTFLFAGFLPPKRAARRTRLATLAAIPATICLFEARQRLPDALADLTDVLGPGRDCAVLRELTKIHEEAVRGRLGDLAAHFAQLDAVRGEIVIVVGPPQPQAAAGPEAIDQALAGRLGTAPLAKIASEVATSLGLPRRTVYARALALRSTEQPSEDDHEPRGPEGIG